MASIFSKYPDVNFHDILLFGALGGDDRFPGEKSQASDPHWSRKGREAFFFFFLAMHGLMPNDMLEVYFPQPPCQNL